MEKRYYYHNDSSTTEPNGYSDVSIELDDPNLDYYPLSTDTVKYLWQKGLDPNKYKTTTDFEDAIKCVKDRTSAASIKINCDELIGKETSGKPKTTVLYNQLTTLLEEKKKFYDKSVAVDEQVEVALNDNKYRAEVVKMEMTLNILGIMLMVYIFRKI